MCQSMGYLPYHKASVGLGGCGGATDGAIVNLLLKDCSLICQSLSSLFCSLVFQIRQVLKFIRVDVSNAMAISVTHQQCCKSPV